MGHDATLGILCGGAVDALLTAVVERDLGARLSEGSGNRKANAVAGTRYQSHLALEGKARENACGLLIHACSYR